MAVEYHHQNGVDVARAQASSALTWIVSQSLRPEVWNVRLSSRTRNTEIDDNQKYDHTGTRALFINFQIITHCTVSFCYHPKSRHTGFLHTVLEVVQQCRHYNTCLIECMRLRRTLSSIIRGLRLVPCLRNTKWGLYDTKFTLYWLPITPYPNLFWYLSPPFSV